MSLLIMFRRRQSIIHHLVPQASDGFPFVIVINITLSISRAMSVIGSPALHPLFGAARLAHPLCSAIGFERFQPVRYHRAPVRVHVAMISALRQRSWPFMTDAPTFQRWYLTSMVRFRVRPSWCPSPGFTILLLYPPTPVGS